MTRILCAMSGGVDSSVAALLLQQQGHDVVGVFMRNGVTGAPEAEGVKKSCCSASDARDARTVSDRLGVPFYSVDYQQEFARLIDHFADEYRQGRTPNPCVLCNQDLKFGHLLEMADAVGADGVATGHYANTKEGSLYRSKDRSKDQTYYLFGVDRSALPRVHFPLGDLDKSEVRAIARDNDLVTADKPESMEICFVTSGDYRDVVRDRGGTGKPGVFRTTNGEIVGEHKGIGGFTVGQRRGLPALGRPVYVQQIDAESGDVVLCDRDGLGRTTALVRGVNWLIAAGEVTARMAAQVQIRANSSPVPAELRVSEGAVHVEFHEPATAVTPGQAAVFYDGERVLGGGWLD